MAGSMNDFDRKVFTAVYDSLLENCHTPLAAELAQGISSSEEEVKKSFRRLAEAHYFLPQKRSGEILMAFPFSAVPTGYEVKAGNRSWYANCAWDALGIIKVIEADAQVKTSCPCCGEAMTLRVENGKLVESDGVIHFAVPARKWWENVVFT